MILNEVFQNKEFILQFTGMIFFISIGIQSIEFLALREHFSEGGIWSWSNIKSDFDYWHSMFHWILRFFKSPQAFWVLILLRMGFLWFALFTAYGKVFVSLSFMVHLLILLRLRGNFNGGSDFMTTQVLIGLLLGYLVIPELGLWYITVQLINSYFVAGLIKVKKNNWRSGYAVQAFVSSPTYALVPRLSFISSSKLWALFFSWSVMIFELAFPLALIIKPLVIPFVLVAFLFHFGNWIGFGLNRFLLAWVATYPAFIFCCLKLL